MHAPQFLFGNPKRQPFQDGGNLGCAPQHTQKAQALVDQGTEHPSSLAWEGVMMIA